MSNLSTDVCKYVQRVCRVDARHGKANRKGWSLLGYVRLPTVGHSVRNVCPTPSDAAVKEDVEGRRDTVSVLRSHIVDSLVKHFPETKGRFTPMWAGDGMDGGGAEGNRGPLRVALVLHDCNVLLPSGVWPDAVVYA